MVYTVARKHASKLRVIAALLGYALPIVLILTPGRGATSLAAWRCSATFWAC